MKVLSGVKKSSVFWLLHTIDRLFGTKHHIFICKSAKALIGRLLFNDLAPRAAVTFKTRWSWRASDWRSGSDHLLGTDSSQQFINPRLSVRISHSYKYAVNATFSRRSSVNTRGVGGSQVKMCLKCGKNQHSSHTIRTRVKGTVDLPKI